MFCSILYCSDQYMSTIEPFFRKQSQMWAQGEVYQSCITSSESQLCYDMIYKLWDILLQTRILAPARSVS